MTEADRLPAAGLRVPARIAILDAVRGGDQPDTDADHPGGQGPGGSCHDPGYLQLPVNQPKSPLHSCNKDGAMRYHNPGDPVYAPNSVHPDLGARVAKASTVANWLTPNKLSTILLTDRALQSHCPASRVSARELTTPCQYVAKHCINNA
jgi:hypothetical protein